MDFSRVDRLQSQLIRELSRIVSEELKDNPPHMITFTRAEISKDLRYATVYFSVLGQADEKNECIVYLKRHAGVIKRNIGRKMRIKHMPEIRYVYDDTSEKVFRISRILDELKDEDNEQ